MFFASEAHWLVCPTRQVFPLLLDPPVNTAVEAMPNGQHQAVSDPYSNRPVDNNWVLLYTNSNWLQRPDYLMITDDDQISYNGGRIHGHAEFVESDHYCGETWILHFSSYYGYQEEQQFVFRPIMGTSNWLHINQPNEVYNCILVPHDNQLTSMFAEGR